MSPREAEPRTITSIIERLHNQLDTISRAPFVQPSVAQAAPIVTPPAESGTSGHATPVVPPAQSADPDTQVDSGTVGQPAPSPGATRARALVSCEDEAHEWTLRPTEADWVCKRCGSTAEWGGPTQGGRGGETAKEEEHDGELADLCPNCEKPTTGPLYVYRGFDMCAPCYEALSGRAPTRSVASPTSSGDSNHTDPAGHG